MASMTTTQIRSTQAHKPLRVTDAEVLRPGDFAIVANANARGFKRAFNRGEFNGIRKEDLFVSRCLEESEVHLQTILDAGYKTIFACGGDGTLMNLVNALRARCAEGRAPGVGVIRMGTGNAIADFAKSDVSSRDLARLAMGTAIERVKTHLVETEGVLCPFAGCGADAAVLNDYIDLKERVSGTPLQNVMTGLSGYMMSGVLKTAPTLLNPRNRRKAFVINNGDTAYSVNAKGDILETFKHGDVLYQGEIIIASAGAIPFFGSRMRMFPNAHRLNGFIQFRVSNMSSVMAVARLGKLWRGDLDRKHSVHDFLVQNVRVEFNEDAPFQCGGDANGYRREVELGVSQRQVEFIRPVDTKLDAVKGEYTLAH